MTLRASKPTFNVREKLTELGRRFGLKGSELAAAETVQEARDLVSAGRRNLIINGAMMVNERYGTSSAVVSDAYVLDRFKFKENHGGAASINRDAFPVSDNQPAGFRYAMQIACSTADTSLTGNEHSVIMHMVEGYNIGGTKFGTPNAENMTLSFWVKTNAPGTYSVALKNGSQNRCQVKEYQVSGGLVWQKIVLTYSGCTDGTWDDGDGIGMKLEFGLAGAQATYATSDLNTWKSSNLFLSPNQRNFFDSTNNRFFITGIQLEIGNNATDFEHRSYGEELALCQRYYYEYPKGNTYNIIANGFANTTSNALFHFQFPVPMRNAPVVATTGNWQVIDGTSHSVTGFSAITDATTLTGRVDATSSGLTVGRGTMLRNNNDATATFSFNAEL